MKSDLPLLNCLIEVFQSVRIRVSLIRGVSHGPDLSACIGCYNAGLACPARFRPLFEFYQKQMGAPAAVLAGNHQVYPFGRLRDLVFYRKLKIVREFPGIQNARHGCQGIFPCARFPYALSTGYFSSLRRIFFWTISSKSSPHRSAIRTQ